LSASDVAHLVAAVGTLAFLTRELEAKGASIRRLRSLIFGPSTEKTRQIFPDGPACAPEADPSTGGPTDGVPGASTEAGDISTAGAQEMEKENEKNDEKNDEKKKEKRKGHGRIGASDYTGAIRVRVPHGDLSAGCCCPECKGEGAKLYRQAEPGLILRVTGMAPLGAILYEAERLRCHICGKVFTAPAPEGVGEEKYDETVSSMIGMLRYGAGLPFNRLEGLQESLGIPLPAGTQWDLVDEAADLLEPASDELVRQAAQGKVLHNDDTTMKILDIDKEIREKAALESGDGDDRTGMFTTGIVSTGDSHPIAIFITGRQHAGENLNDVLAKRSSELEPPIQMCDGLDRNKPGVFATIMANCLTHARRKYVDVADDFPEECLFVLKILGKVYFNDAVAREREMSPEERLRWHQTHSGPLMEELHRWSDEQLAERKVEPNGGLGKALRYMDKHWTKLTLFLKTAGAPLDNNICERALKKAILHRKNSLFYKTANGARVGDIFMNLIYTAEINKVNPFAYLVALQRNHEDVKAHPDRWLPWTFRDRMAEIGAVGMPA
jgi:transposase